jgi:hypothetical protein
VKQSEKRADTPPPSAENVERTSYCSTCHEIVQMFWDAHEHVMRVADLACRTGSLRGVYLTTPKDFDDRRSRAVADRLAARNGGYYVDPVWRYGLQAWSKGRQTHPQRTAEVMKRLAVPAPPGQVHVVGARQGCVMTRRVQVYPASAYSTG